MLIKYENLTIRNAVETDSKQLTQWWNNGEIMAHAGFPNGLGTTEQTVSEQLSSDNDEIHRRLILEIDDTAVGEMNYRNIGDKTAVIDIKICDFSKQNNGNGKIFLSMCIASLLKDYGYEKIILDTNLKNTRAQHVYEQLGFRKLRVNENSWRNQLGEIQSSVDYELTPEDFHSFI